jgi:hypothetical protein
VRVKDAAGGDSPSSDGAELQVALDKRIHIIVALVSDRSDSVIKINFSKGNPFGIIEPGEQRLKV